MLKLSKAGRALAMTAAATALAGGAVVGLSGNAFADSGSYSLSAGGCTGGESWDTNHVWGWVTSSGAMCHAWISQNGSSYSYTSWDLGGTFYTRTYWRGWASSGAYLTDQVCIQDGDNGSIACAPAE